MYIEPSQRHYYVQIDTFYIFPSTYLTATHDIDPLIYAINHTSSSESVQHMILPLMKQILACG